MLLLFVGAWAAWNICADLYELMVLIDRAGEIAELHECHRVDNWLQLLKFHIGAMCFRFDQAQELLMAKYRELRAQAKMARLAACENHMKYWLPAK